VTVINDKFQKINCIKQAPQCESKKTKTRSEIPTIPRDKSRDFSKAFFTEAANNA